MDEEQTWPQIPGLFKSVVVALTGMRRNRVQAESAETDRFRCHPENISTRNGAGMSMPLLSAHEHRIAVRAVGRLVNQDIGDDFDVCARTVEHRVMNVYTASSAGTSCARRSYSAHR